MDVCNSSSPFGGESSYTNINTTFASCSSGVVGQLDLLLTSLSGQAFKVYYFDSLVGFDQPSITSCTKVFNSSFPFYILEGWSATLNWSAPNCGKCEAKGEYCKLTENSTSSNVGIADYSTVCLSRGMHIHLKYLWIQYIKMHDTNFFEYYCK